MKWFGVGVGVAMGLSGIWMMVQPDRFRVSNDPRMVERLADLMDRPRSNPLRWFALLMRFLDARPYRAVMFGASALALGAFIALNWAYA